MNNESIWIKVLFDFMEQKGDIGKERKIIEPLVNENIRLHSIIKEVREKLEYLLTHDKVEINGTIYLKQEADDFITNYILEILDKENKEWDTD